MRQIKYFATILSVFIVTLVAMPAPGHAENFFDSPAKVQKAIDASLLEGMRMGHNGLILKTAHFMDQEATVKDAPSKIAMNKIAWYSSVNAHRMLDALLPEIQNPDTRREMTGSLRVLDSGISLLGKRFGWNDATTKSMYSKTRGLIEARISDLSKSAFSR